MGNVDLNAQDISIGGDVVDGDKHVHGNEVHGDKIGGDKVMGDKYEAPAPIVQRLHQLPAPPRDFTGREAELAELLAKVEQGGVTVTGLRGMGGIGKTALALKLAEKLAPNYPNAQLYLDMQGTSSRPLTPAEAMTHVVRAYHPTAPLPDTQAELQGLYRTVLHGQHALLLMDNAAGRAQVEPLLPPASCLLLVTSRQHFALPGLHACDLDTLPSHDAQALLLRIAARIDGHAEEMAKLCGYLPLALRVTASALAEQIDLAPADHIRRLADATQRLKLTSVDASLNLSYNLLTPGSQTCWRALAVFPTDFDRAAAAAVWDIKADLAADAIGELLRYSLVDWNESTNRYSLHDLARLFADTRLGGERPAAQRRHAVHYKDVLSAANDLYLQGGENILRGLSL